MIVDSNAYLGIWPYWRVQATEADQLVSYLEKNGIGKALVSSLKSVFYDAEEGNGELAKACSRYPDMIFGLATLTAFSRREDVGYQGLASGLFKGIRIYPAYHGYPLSNSSKIIEIAEAMKVPVVVPYRLIMSWNLPTIAIEGVVRLAEENPGIPFVISSLNYEAYEFLSLEEKPLNLYLETSALQNEGGAELLSNTFGRDKVMLGTAAPVQYARPGIEKILGSDLADEQKAMITHLNATRLFHL